MRYRLIFLSTLLTGSLQAQNVLTPMQNLDALEQMITPPEVQSLPSAPVLEHPVDPESYILGPGDVLEVVIDAQPEFSHQGMVSPEGLLLIPNVGTVELAGLTLSEAKTRIVERVRRRYPFDEIHITLTRVRSFRVTVSGAVENPGLVMVTAMDRVSDAIKEAGGFLKSEGQAEEPLPKLAVENSAEMETQPSTPVQSAAMPDETSAESPPTLPSKRNIRLFRRDGSPLKADLLKYQRNGDLSANPHLLDGDVIVVPVRSDKVGEVWIKGGVNSPDKFEFVPGDRLRNLIELAHGFSADADSSRIELVRFQENGRVTEKSILTVNSETMDMPLRADDRLFVRLKPHYHRKRNVEIEGEVFYPGMYAIGDGRIRLSDVVELAGGFTPAASLENAHVIRRAHEKNKDPELERLRGMRVMDMSEMEREYFKIKMREQEQRLVVDFRALYEEGDRSQDIHLLDNDLIVVPEKERTVKVEGFVAKPGLLPYVEGEDYSYYIREAGGYNFNARKSKVRIIKNRTGEWKRAKKDVLIEEGDTLFVPEKPERNWWEIGRDIISVTVQLVTIYIIVERYSN